MKLKIIPIFLLFSFLLMFYGCTSSSNQTHSLLPGNYQDYVLLPNGWKLTPIGNNITIGEFPLNMLVIPDRNLAITSNSGTGENSISLINLENFSEQQRIKLPKVYRGIAYSKKYEKIFVSGGNDNLVYVFKIKNQSLELIDSVILGKKYPKDKISITGLDVSDNKNLLIIATKEDNSIYIYDLKKDEIKKQIKLEAKCYDVKINNQQNYAYISLWGKSKIIELNLSTLEISNIISVGDHPCEILMTNDDRFLFVSNANNNSTSVIDLFLKREVEKIISSLDIKAPYGSTPNSIALDKDENTLYIANADNNYIAVFDVSKKGDSKILGFIPTGWYPTAVRCYDGKILFVNGKGNSSQANPEGPNPFNERNPNIQYIGSLFKGSLTVVDVPSQKELQKFTELVFQNTPYTAIKPKLEENNVFRSQHNLKPSNKIEYVFYIIKENRTYDQVFGDIPKGNGDSSLCIFPEVVTPNQHSLAETFALFDNFYVDAEVSADGHNWSTAAYATDYVEKIWPVLYGSRGGNYDFEGGVPIAAPSSGYIWDNAIKNNVSFRNYGEFTEKIDKNLYRAKDKSLVDCTCDKFPGYDLSTSDLIRYDVWSNDFDSLLKINSLPKFSLMRLPNDHTAGTKKNELTPLAYVAQNDYALGKVVEKISKSKIWEKSVIFVLEDDAQNGSDHVDAHRSTLLIISPYLKRNIVDHNFYTTSGVLKTIELILGLPPMTQFDLSADPIIFPFTDKIDISNYNVIEPKINIHETNKPDAYGSLRCSEFNLSKEDAIPDIEFNEIIWKSIKGSQSEMPPIVRSAFVKRIDTKEEDD